jgi:uncharacterized membrane protein YgcG
MPLLEYNGNIRYIVYNNTTPPKDLQTFYTSFASMTINWTTPNIPNELRGKTISDLDNPLFRYSYTLTTQIFGTQRYSAGSAPRTDITVRTTSNTEYYDAYEPPHPNIDGIGHYNINETFAVSGLPNIYRIKVGNNCSGNSSGCYQHNATGYSLVFTLNITLTINCVGEDLNNSFCSAFCSNPSNRSVCLSDVTKYCFPNNVPPDEMPIGNNLKCQSFVSNYIENVSPLAEFDTGLKQYCSKYEGFGDLFNDNDNITDAELCACQLPLTQYNNYADELFKLFPGYSTFGSNKYCLVSYCASSPYRNVSIGAKCNVPQCLNILSFENNGTFDNSDIIINQTGQCESLTNNNNNNGGGGNGGGGTGGNGGGGGGGTGGETGGGGTVTIGGKTFTTKSILIGVGIAVVVIIIIIIIIVVATSKKNKSTTVPVTT